ncbi:hypothetical protein LTR37_002837 [Vermiconidia calcicola]|uniref:Uncharacterized protein n=1 Tax=Vermiconidia calcicola TaxID=1690605 RepID=A0ACC3NSI4_9PEZI|nr:hypothetical protein LTR37_002837 [Vermiconidia calcicola]
MESDNATMHIKQFADEALLVEKEKRAADTLVSFTSVVETRPKSTAGRLLDAGETYVELEVENILSFQDESWVDGHLSTLLIRSIQPDDSQIVVWETMGEGATRTTECCYGSLLAAKIYIERVGMPLSAENTNDDFRDWMDHLGHLPSWRITEEQVAEGIEGLEGTSLLDSVDRQLANQNYLALYQSRKAVAPRRLKTIPGEDADAVDDAGVVEEAHAVIDGQPVLSPAEVVERIDDEIGPEFNLHDNFGSEYTYGVKSGADLGNNRLADGATTWFRDNTKGMPAAIPFQGSKKERERPGFKLKKKGIAAEEKRIEVRDRLMKSVIRDDQLPLVQESALRHTIRAAHENWDLNTRALAADRASEYAARERMRKELGSWFENDEEERVFVRRKTNIVKLQFDPDAEPGKALEGKIHAQEMAAASAAAAHGAAAAKGPSKKRKLNAGGSNLGTSRKRARRNDHIVAETTATDRPESSIDDLIQRYNKSKGSRTRKLNGAQRLGHVTHEEELRKQITEASDLLREIDDACGTQLQNAHELAETDSVLKDEEGESVVEEESVSGTGLAELGSKEETPKQNEPGVEQQESEVVEMENVGANSGLY